MTAIGELTKFRCPVCGHWCLWSDGYGWFCGKRGGCGSEWPAEMELDEKS